MKKRKNRHKVTEDRNSHTYNYYFCHFDGSVLLKTMFIILLFIPILCVSCGREIAVYESTTGLHRFLLAFSKGQTFVEDYKADIFIYDNDNRGRLDSYETGVDLSERMDIVCCRGNKKAVIIASPEGGKKIWDKETPWEEIGSYQSLKEKHLSIRMENPEQPTITGEIDLYTNNSLSHISLSTNLHKFRIRSIRKDFSGKAYEKEPVKDITLYIVNAAETCPILMKDKGYSVSSYVNKGRLKEEDLNMMDFPEMLFHNSSTDIGEDTYYLNTDLYCFPNPCTEEDAANVFTRLVVEGKIMGKTWYWPINLEFHRDEAGKWRNCTYLDIVITGTGSTDPDIAVTREQAKIHFNIKEWEKEDEKDIFY